MQSIATKTSLVKTPIIILAYVVVWAVSAHGQTDFATKETPGNRVPRIEIPETRSASGLSRGSRINALDYKPMPLPSVKPAANISGEENRLVMHDIATGQTTSLTTTPSTSEESAIILGVPGITSKAGIGDEQDQITAFSNLARISGSDAYPWRVNVKLIITFSRGTFVCSGVLIDARHVLTAGHCIYDDVSNSWASAVRVVPAYDNGSTPYGDANATNLYSWTGWTVNENFDWDMGYILLDRPVGALTGWHGYGYDNNDVFFTSNTFNNPGYPAASPYNGESMYNWFGNYDQTQVHRLYHNNLAYGGQSGSGSYYIDANRNRYVYAVLSHGISGPQTGHTRIISDRFSSISSRIAANTPGQADLVALDARVTPSTLNAGDRPSSISFVLHNYSSVTWSGAFDIKWYLSTNDFISTSDVLLQTRTFNGSIDPKGTIRLSDTVNLPAIPLATVSNNYWIGVILDISDADNANNNTEGWDPMPVTINGRPVLNVSTGSIDLGMRLGGSTFSSSFVVSNDGGETLTGTVSQNAPWITSLNPTSFSLTPGQTNTIVVQGNFHASSPGPFSAPVNIASNAPSNGNRSVIISGVSTSSITVSAPVANASWEVGKTQKISWTVAGSAIANVKLELSRDNGRTYKTLVANAVNDGNEDWPVVPPVSSQCVFRISEAQSHPQVIPGISPAFAIIAQPFTQVTKQQAGGDQQSAYRLFSVPGRLDNPAALAVLEDDLGAYNIKKWRLFDYRNGGFTEYPNVGDFSAGRSMFLITRETATIDAGPGKFVGDSIFTINLPSSGWHLVANPYNFDIPVSALSLNTNDARNLITYTGSWSSPVTVIKPGEGYAIKVAGPATLTIRPNFPGSASMPKPQTPALAEALWSIQILARSQQARDENNFAGVSLQADERWDVTDLYEPPGIGDFVMISFPHQEWGEHADHYTTDFRDATQALHGNLWEFAVRSNIDAHVDLSFAAVQSVPSELDVYLLDEQAGIVQNLRTEPQYALLPLSNSSGKVLKLAVGPKAFVDEIIATITATPAAFALQQNYPNPFNPETAIRFGLPEKSRVTLKIYDVAGREVMTLLDNKELEAGWHQHIWAGHNINGKSMASGVYFYSLRAGKFTKTLKMTLLR